MRVVTRKKVKINYIFKIFLKIINFYFELDEELELEEVKEKKKHQAPQWKKTDVNHKLFLLF